MPKKKATSLDLMRQILGSITIQDIEEKDLSETERKAYCAAIFAVYPRIEKDILRATNEQLRLTFETADNMDKVTLGQGTVNGMSILLELWKKAASEYEAKSGKEDFDENNPIAEL
jgi:hypothetical protein